MSDSGTDGSYIDDAGNSSPVSCLEWLWVSELISNHKLYILLTAPSFAFIMCCKLRERVLITEKNVRMNFRDCGPWDRAMLVSRAGVTSSLFMGFSMCLILSCYFSKCFLLLEFPICPGFPRKYCSKASMELVFISAQGIKE